MERRHFLKLLAVLTSQLPAFSPRSAAASTGKSIIVIGAGISGLAAASRLAANGCAVTVLEARSRIGGRIFTDTSLGFPVDMGASWIHGIEGNPITVLADQAGAARYNTDQTETVFFSPSGDRYSKRAVRSGLRAFRRIFRRACRRGNALNNDKPFSKMFSQAFRQERSELSKSDIQIIRFQLRSLMGGDLGADARDLSSIFKYQEEAFSGDEVIFPDGYGAVTDSLARGLDIRFSEIVSEIRYSGDTVEVLTSNATFSADHVVVTLPLGVLKSGDVIFTPELPTRKQLAIERLDMGVLAKLYLEFPTAFWESDELTSGFLQNARRGKRDQRELTYFLNLFPATGRAALFGFLGGDAGRQFEKLSEEEAVQRAMITLRRWYGDSVPQPIRTLQSKWSIDPYSYGSYSHIPVNALASDYTALADSVDGKVHFAGEATNRAYPQTVHGAYLSGIREADKILED